jgi:ubiquinone/menaquinone biosynthesis C-methylase UbiE
MAWSEADSHLYQGLASIAVPRRAEQMAAILTLLPFGPEDTAKVVELCCGEGRLTASVLHCFPAVQALALDGSAEMRARAEERLAEFGQRARVGALDLAATDWWLEMDAADAVISSLAIHHLSGEQKRRLFEAVARRLSARGALLIADLVEPQRPEAGELFGSTWDAAAEANATALRAPHTYQQFVATQWNYFRFPDPVDTPSSLFDQLCWMRDAGLGSVDCYWLDAGHAIYGGYRDISAAHPQLAFGTALAVATRCAAA